MCAQNWWVSGQVVEVVHDDSHEQVKHKERAEEDEGDKISVGHCWPASFLWVKDPVGCLIVLVGHGVAWPALLAGQHDAGPRLACGTPEQHHDAGPERLEVDVPVVLCVRVEVDVPEYLHPDDGIDEEQHGNEQDDVGKSLERLDEGPQKDTDGVALPQQLHKTSCAKQAQKADIDEVFLQQ